MKQVLAIYYSQTGQGKQALDAVLKPFSNSTDFQITYLNIKPKIPFPYPWSYMQFFDAFPETVKGVPCELESMQIDTTVSYDLVFIAYQPWFLSVCVPINSFLQSNEAKLLLKNKPIVTVINCRNMWLGAQEKMKQQLINLQANLVGNITFVDHASNLTSLVTVLAYVLKGTKEKFLGIFPKYGITQADIDKAPEYGKIILDNVTTSQLNLIQPQLVEKGAVSIRGNLLLMEGRGRALFPLYAKFILKKGEQGSQQRRTRVRIFGIVLPTAILLLSPIITVLSRLIPVLAKRKFKQEIAYYAQNNLR